MIGPGKLLLNGRPLNGWLPGGWRPTGAALAVLWFAVLAWPGAAVLAAYGFSPQGDLLAQLLKLNLAVAARIDSHQQVTAPGLPPSFPDPKRLITDDCIRP